MSYQYFVIYFYFCFYDFVGKFIFVCFLVLFCLLALERVRKSKVTWIKRWGGSGRKWVGEKHDQYLFYENVFTVYQKLEKKEL